VSDDPWVLAFFEDHKHDDAKALAHAVVNNDALWDGELNKLPGFEEAVAADLEHIEKVGMYKAMEECLE